MITLTRQECLFIFEIQQRYINAGYQWSERIFNDGYYRNCRIYFTSSKNPQYFSQFRIGGDFGWGRFDRRAAWEMAGAYLDKIVAGTIVAPVPTEVPY